MKWFKHMSNLSQDVRIKRLVKRYGIEGYGLYLYIIELIVRRLETESPLPDLEESSNDIATDMKMDTVRVEEIMWFCIEQGLFEQDELTGRIVAHKVYKFLQQSETRSKEIRSMIEHYKTGKESPLLPEQTRPGLSETNVKNRTEQNRTEQNRWHTHTTRDGDEVPCNATRYQRLCDTYGTTTTHDYIERAVRYAVAKKGSLRHYKDYAAAAEDYMRRDGVKPVDTSGIIDDAAIARMREPE